MEIQDIFINLFEKEIVNIDIRYLWNVYVLKMRYKLASFEIILGNNIMLNGESLILMSEGLKNLQ